jgi:poly(3-hydroxybutyrate) depolymerase
VYKRQVSQQDYLHEGRTVLQRLLIHGLGHAWSGGDAEHPFNDAAGPNASELLWAFLSGQRSSVSPESPVA